MTAVTDQAAFRTAFAGVPGFVYRNWLTLTLLSVLWFVASVPLVTIGPATLGMYAAIQDLRSDQNRIDRARVFTVLRERGIASLLFSGLPVVFAVVAGTYGLTAIQQQSLLGEAIALLAAYIALYLALALIPTYVALARGADPVDAFRYGIGWLVSHPTPALSMGLLSVLLLLLTALLTVGFVLLFAGFAFSLQVAVVETVDSKTADSPVQERFAAL
ncbi:hypothetical protein ACFQL1_17045 [Halomicroarcula sp. GCM10025709]|uniref:hypothetical protein n=1 Tax=Haloarcula TaxID=2237 RepID=UPI0024C2A151|nr:hypothetical protein [Halomicroarcula sp. YJ-61-S]